MKKVLSMTVIVLMVLALAMGCGQTGGKQDNASTSPVASTAVDNTADKKPITFTMFIGETNSNDDQWQSPVAQEITKRTGVTLQIEYLVSGDEKQKLSLMAASGDYPDMLFAKGNLQIVKNVNGVIKLDDLIEKYGANIKRFYGDQIKRLHYGPDDPGIYYVGGKELGQENMEPNSGFQLQHAVVKELGFPRMRTLTDYENAIKQYLEKHPTYDGQKTIGLSLLADDWRALISLTNPACFATGGPDDGEWYVDQKTLKVTRHLLRPEEKEYFRWLNHMNSIGLLDPESFIQKYDQYKAKIASGKILALADSRWEIDEALKALQKAGKEDRMYGFYPLTMDESTKYADFMDCGYLGGWGIAITSKCKDPVRAIKFLDWMCTEEAQILNHWGIEGVHYTVENGKRILKPEIKQMQAADPAFKKKTGITQYCYPFPTYGNTVKDSTGQYYEAFITMESIMGRQTAIENEVLKAYGAKAWKELYPQKDQFPVKVYGAAWLMNSEDPEYTAADNKVMQIGWKRIAEAVLAKPDKFDEVWDKYVSEVKAAGVDGITATFEKLVGEKARMWQ